MGEEQEIAGHTIIPISGAIAQPHIFINDHVLVRITDVNEEYWAPGIVIVLPSASAFPPPLYMVQVYTPSAQYV